METRIMLSRPDLLWLRTLLGAHARTAAVDREHLLYLQDELDRAVVVEVESLPADVVALASCVTVLDLESGVHSEYTLVLPSQADVAEGRISVLAPLGTTLLGCRVGDEVEWRMPGGLRRLRIEAVKQSQHLDDGPPGKRLAA
ncbi:MAG TPA: GreA/GreB family elongation factor [Povalibacter sp.]|nr:GreA/GreB family elongation factor [Povalibacter sp.]